ncbi:MAG: class C sortase [Roseburia faecis]|nr:class C sortase [Roseburia faecis]
MGRFLPRMNSLVSTPPNISMKRNANQIINIIAIIGFICCTLALLYPVISDTWNRYVDSKRIAEYATETTGDNAEVKEAYDRAIKYNEELGNSVTQVVTTQEYIKSEAYDSLLNLSDDGMMGYLEIPCIDVTEGIYHYTTEKVLANGIGHIHGSSLPVGGENSHAVLTGHRGLPSQKFLSDLDKMNIGDTFYIHVLGRTLAYKVCQIDTVLPSEVESLKIEKNRDLVTLVTCTPYGVNTHRLLVTGERIPFDESNVNDNGLVTTEQHTRQYDPALIIFFSFMLIILMMGITSVIRKHRPGNKIVYWEDFADIHHSSGG